MGAGAEFGAGEKKPEPEPVKNRPAPQHCRKEYIYFLIFNKCTLTCSYNKNANFLTTRFLLLKV